MFDSSRHHTDKKLWLKSLGLQKRLLPRLRATRNPLAAPSQLPHCRHYRPKPCLSLPTTPLWPVSDCSAYQECLSEVLYKNNVTICCIPLCVKDCPFVRRDGQSRCLPGRTVLQIEQSSNAMGRDIEESDLGFRSRIEVINTVLDYCPIPPVTCF